MFVRIDTLRINMRRKWWISGLLYAFSVWNITEAQIRYTIPEEQNEGTVVGNIAKDLDLKLSDVFERNLQIAVESGKQYFGVDSTKGELVVRERIDRENLCQQMATCILPLEAILENPLQLHRFEIEIQDINDNSPVFLKKENTLDIYESIASGARFRLESAQDPDVGSNSLRTYTLSKNEYFALDVKIAKDGSRVPELVIEKSLDREKQSVISLTLTALDGGKPARSGTTKISISVLDTNDNAPSFKKTQYDEQITENTTPGVVVLSVTAIDLDEGANKEVSYSFGPHTPDTVSNLFSVDPANGEIKVKNTIDYETDQSFDFDIVARDKGSPPMEGVCSVHLDVLDINDNAPEIILKSSPSPVREDAPSGTVVALISTKDLDKGDNGQVTLTLLPGTPFSLKTSLSNHYALITDQKLDRETHSAYSVVIVASDSGSPQLTSKQEILVNVLDVNDNAPVFTQQSYVVHVKENSAAGSILCSVSASDPDQGENAKVAYSILESRVLDAPLSSYIYINSDNGTIFSMHSFDHEKMKMFQIKVQAKDNGSPSLSSNATVHVFIVDQNDNTPAVIYPSALMGSVSHQRLPRSAKAGHLVTKVTAVDADSGHNAWISYRLAEATDASLFTVSLHTGEVRTKRSVSEQDDSSQRLLIEIKDNGEPVQSTTVTLDILIEDAFHEPISDFRHKNPEPDQKSSKITLYLMISLASVSFLCLVTFFVLLIKCARSSRGSSTCCIRRSDGESKNHNRNLQIQLNTDGPIKYVEVLGGDMMSQSQSFGSYLSPMSEFSDFTLVKPSSTTDFTNTLSVLDASLPDSTWTFESQQQSLARRDSVHNENSFRVSVLGCRLWIRTNILTCNGFGNRMFIIIARMEMGALTWKSRYSRQMMWLLCLVWSTIEAQIRYSIPEELKKGSVVGNIAKDLDLGLSEIYDRKLQIASESGKQYFGIDLGKGEIIITDRVDREQICATIAKCTLTLEAIIENPLQMYRVEIDIQDVNDNSPFFLNNQIVVNVEEARVPGARFRLETAKDPDIGSNSLQSYVLSKNEYFVLSVKNKDGVKTPELVLEKALDREKLSTHNLVLTAVDGGNPARSGTTALIVQVQDSNDNSPIFEKPTYKVKLPENTARETVILTVKAKDADEGANSELIYSFEPSTPTSIQNVFSIDQENGAITVKDYLDYESVSSFKFEVIASDKGASSLEGLCSVEIEIVDVNDNVPEIILKSLPKPVREDAAPGTVVALIGAKDSDSGENGKVRLSIQPGLPFTLKPSISNYYALVTDSNLDQETFPKYTVEIIAEDSGNPPLRSKTQISVEVLDVNDNPPVFLQSSYVTYIKENVNAGNVVCTVSASDPDQGENAKISYSITESRIQGMSISSYFYINSDNGSIFSMHSFDYERIKVFQIKVQAKDNGSPALSSNATVHVFIVDQNDNAPAVIYPSALMGSVSHQRLPRSAKAGHLVTKVTAVDADSGHNAWISYRLAEATDASLFTVSLHTGEVRTKRSVSEQDDSSQRLLIEIKDNGDSVQSTTVTLDILIEDAFHEPISDFRHKNPEPDQKSGKITLYLMISLASVSFLCLVTFFVLLIKCARGSRGSSTCCIRRSDGESKNHNRNLQIQLNTDGPIKYVEVLGGDMMSQSQSFGSYLSPMSEFSDFTLVKPSSTTDFTNTLSVLDASLPDSTWTFESQQVRGKAHMLYSIVLP
ncbi:uncharacterized protein Hap1MRO34_019683 [Clarias gariepinus]|uniref:uncharacterized protein LOC128505532 n=1 Tax=Clarias gariepinus TaxID=13013 RepID=UPI00234CFB1C|nr:uncharacterized protein LOC128505532 [Clarias gariepinus]